MCVYMFVCVYTYVCACTEHHGYHGHEKAELLEKKGQKKAGSFSYKKYPLPGGHLILMIPALGRLAQEYHCGFEGSLGYMVNPRQAWLTYRMKPYLKPPPSIKKRKRKYPCSPVSVAKPYKEYYGLKCVSTILVPHQT